LVTANADVLEQVVLDREQLAVLPATDRRRASAVAVRTRSSSRAMLEAIAAGAT
jgi:hypothetical protein